MFLHIGIALQICCPIYLHLKAHRPLLIKNIIPLVIISFMCLTFHEMGSGCGRAVASDPEVRGSKPVIGKNLFISIEHLYTVNCVLEGRK